MSRELLIAQMKRCIELLEKNPEPTKGIKYHYGLYSVVNKEFSELDAKLKEVRRDSIRFIKERRK